jgi:hypothetical protein
MRLSISHASAVTSMSTTTAAIFVAIAVAIGWYGAKWLRAEAGADGARKGAASAGQAMWAARRVMFGVALILAWVVNLWIRGGGR